MTRSQMLPTRVNSLTEPSEIACSRRAPAAPLDYIKHRHEATVRWLEFQPPPGVRVSIPHQRNLGVRESRGDIIVFTDAGCRPLPGWLACLVAALRQDESVVAGIHQDPSGAGLYDLPREEILKVKYVRESPTLNYAFRREVFDAVGGFDETFAYGSDVDFCWRLIDIGYRIRLIPDAIVQHDWGTPQRQRRRSYMYGKARAHLYRKHRARRMHVLRDDPMVVVSAVLARAAAHAGFSFVPIASSYTSVAQQVPWGNPGACRPSVVRCRRSSGTHSTMKVLALPREETNPYHFAVHGDASTWRAG